MRSAKSRSRNKSNRNRSVGNITNRVFESSGPEGKVRGTPAQIIEKYNQLARDAQLANDPVAAENFRQHAEHYTRLLSEAQREIEARREQQEAQQRERQREREQNRNQRNGRRGDGEGQAPQPGAAAQISDPLAVEGVDPAQTPQPDVLGVSPLVEESVIVDTPESRAATDAPAPAQAREKPRRKPRARKPKAEDQPESAPDAAAGGKAGGDPASEAPAPQAEGNAPKPEAPEAAE